MILLLLVQHPLLDPQDCCARAPPPLSVSVAVVESVAAADLCSIVASSIRSDSLLAVLAALTILLLELPPVPPAQLPLNSMPMLLLSSVPPTRLEFGRQRSRPG